MDNMQLTSTTKFIIQSPLVDKISSPKIGSAMFKTDANIKEGQFLQVA